VSIRAASARKRRRDESRLLGQREKLQLKRNAQTELNPAAALRAIGRNQFLADDAEGSRVLEVQGWLKEIDVVEDVKEVR